MCDVFPRLGGKGDVFFVREHGQATDGFLRDEKKKTQTLVDAIEIVKDSR